MSGHFIYDDCIEVKDGKVQIDAGLFEGHEDGSFPIAWVTPAKPDHVRSILRQGENTGDGRSNWVWLRLRDGTLMLGVFPQGDTYMEFSDGGVCDFGDEA